VKILILDHDLGFQFWLAKSLEPFGYSIIPADTVSQAKRLLRQLKLSLDLLMVNPAVEGAAEFTASLHRHQPLLKVVALVPEQGKESSLRDLHPDARRAKPDPSVMEHPAGESSAESDWARFVQEVTGRRTTGGRAN
jgi:hypothetical protein